MTFLKNFVIDWWHFVIFTIFWKNYRWQKWQKIKNYDIFCHPIFFI